MKYLTNSYKFFFIFTPIAVLLGPFTLGLFVVFQSLIFLTILNKKIILLIKNKYFIYFILWCLYLIFCSLISDNVLYSLESSLFYFRFGLYAISIAFFINNYNNFLKIFTYVLNCAVIFLIIDGLIQYITYFDIFGFPQKGGRLSGPFKDEYILGGVIAKMLPVLIVSNLYFLNNNRWNLIFLFLILVFSGFVIFLSGERWSTFFILSYILIISVTINYKLFKIKFQTFFISFIFIFLAFFLLIQFSFVFTPKSGVQIKDRLLKFTIQQFNAKENEIYFEENKEKLKYTKFTKNYRILSIEHQAFYETAISIYINNKLTGVGPKMFRVKCKKYPANLKHNSGLIYDGCQTHPHNIYLQLFSETGIGALPIIILFIFYSIQIIIHTSKKFFYNHHLITNYDLIILISLFIIFIPILPSSNFFGSWNSFFIYFLIGFYLKDRIKWLQINYKL